MEAAPPLTKEFAAKLKQAFYLWLENFGKAFCLHRVVVLSCRSKKLMIRTGQCFLLNGLIYLGSIIILNSVIISTIQWILPHQLLQIRSKKSGSSGAILKFYSFLRVGLKQLFYFGSGVISSFLICVHLFQFVLTATGSG